MQAGMHEIAVNVIVHYKASTSVVFLCLFIMVLINTLCGVFILHLLRKGKGCCMHVFSSRVCSYEPSFIKLETRRNAKRAKSCS